MYTNIHCHSTGTTAIQGSRVIYLIVVLLASFLAYNLVAQPKAESPSQGEDAITLLAKAEALYEDGSFAKANAIFVQLAASRTAEELVQSDGRWIRFRVADTQWRARASSRHRDQTIINDARQRLDDLIREITRPADRDRVWAECQESVGDLVYNIRSNRWNRTADAIANYKEAMSWWESSTEIDLARTRYLDMVWKLTKAPNNRMWSTSYLPRHMQSIPDSMLRNARRIADNDEDLAHATFCLAISLQHSSRNGYRAKIVGELFEEIIALKKTTEWYDDALFHYAGWLANDGKPVVQDDGSWRSQRDFVQALELFRQLTSEFKTDESAYFVEAQNAIKAITEPSLSVFTGSAFLPGSEIRYHTYYRNVKDIAWTLYKVDLTEDLDLTRTKKRSDDPVDMIDTQDAAVVQQWIQTAKKYGTYEEVSEVLRLERNADDPLPMGAYVLEARSGEQSDRELILVSDVMLMTRHSDRQSLIYLCNAMDGSPVADAAVKTWDLSGINVDDTSFWKGTSRTHETNENGIAMVPRMQRNNNTNRGNNALVTVVNHNGRQAFAFQYRYNRGRSDDEPDSWRIYTFADRPAYRPEDTVQWKIIARTDDGSRLATPAGRELRFEITDPMGSTVKEGALTLNAFGSATSSLELNKDLPLGEYHVDFSIGSKGESLYLGRTLFRLEEYKLPEFKVTIESAVDEATGQPVVYRTGDIIDATINAEYYFGGPVAGADVEVIVYRNDFSHHWYQPRAFLWCFQEDPRNDYYWGRNWGREEVLREKIKTDDQGKAIITIETPTDEEGSYEFTIEARVVDSSRREVMGSGSIKVTMQSYYIYPKAKHTIHQPGDQVDVTFKAMDPNDHPRAITGTVKVLRKTWIQRWVSPAGVEVPWKQVQAIRQEQGGLFPPPDPKRPHHAPDPGWEMRFEGYDVEEILTRELTTDIETGEATLSFEAPREGYYEIQWVSLDAPGMPIHANTTVWVSSDTTRQLGYHLDGVDIILDKDTFKAGQTTPIMIATDSNDRYVLLTVEGSDLHHHELIHVTGNVKMVELKIDERFVPNVWINATVVQHGELFMDNEAITIPPTEHFLNVEIASSNDSLFGPQEEGQFTIRTTDVNGEPVSAEVAVSLIDESIYAIQSEYAGDPREFFFNRPQYNEVESGGSLNYKRFTRLKMNRDGDFIETRLFAEEGEFGYAYSISTESEGGMHLGGAFERGEVTGSLFDDESADAFGGRRSARGMAAPAESAAPQAKKMGRNELKKDGNTGEQSGAVTVRTDFRATALWRPSVITDKNGLAVITATYPDTLTSWKATARAMTMGNQTGIADTSTKTRKPLIVRLQGPRFFIVGDRATLSAVVNNNTNEPMTAVVSLKADGLDLVNKAHQQTITVPAHADVRCNWDVNARTSGIAAITAEVRASGHSDAMQLSYPVYEHGIDRLLVQSGKVRGESVAITMDIPAERKRESTEMVVQVTPSMAVTMLDALPYLIDYPYGCTEQTMSRFLPTAITLKTLNDFGLDRGMVASRVFGGIEEDNLELLKRKQMQARDLDRIEDMTQASLKRLKDMQHGDGGWGWWKHGESDLYMTAYVVWGLALAKEADVDIDADMLKQGVKHLRNHIVNAERQYDLQTWILHALATAEKTMNSSTAMEKAYNNIWNNRDQLSAYTTALLALSAHHLGDDKRAMILIDNLENGVIIDDRPDLSVIVRGTQDDQPKPAVMRTAHWGEDGLYYRWSDGGVESTAFVLRAMLAIKPDHELIEPTANWLIKNRRGAQWSNTRDTAITVLAMCDYLKTTGELDQGISYAVIVNGQTIATPMLTKEELFTAPSRFVVDRDLIDDGENTIEINRTDGNSKGALYFSVETSFFSLEEPIPASGNELFVRRQYFRLIPEPTLLKGFQNRKVPLNDGDMIRSGERVEVVLTIEAKNNFEYLLIEDLKPAGFEAINLTSGPGPRLYQISQAAVDRQFGKEVNADADDPFMTRDRSADYVGSSQQVHQEWRDQKIAMFADRLKQGYWEIRYELRAEVPGKFHALPTLAHAMYVPEIKANGQEIRVVILEKAE